MGLATIDPHRKGTPTFTKSPSLVLIGLVLTEIQAFKNVKCMAMRTNSDIRPDLSASMILT